MGIYYDNAVIGIRYKGQNAATSEWIVIATFSPDTHGETWSIQADAYSRGFPDGRRYIMERLHLAYSTHEIENQPWKQWLLGSIFDRRYGQDVPVELEDVV